MFVLVLVLVTIVICESSFAGTFMEFTLCGLLRRFEEGIKVVQNEIEVYIAKLGCGYVVDGRFVRTIFGDFPGKLWI